MQNEIPGLTGLVNLGNTCFLNSCIQILNNTDELIYLLHDVIEKKTKKDIPESFIIDEWIELRSLMWKRNGIVSPNKFVFGVHRLASIKQIEIFTGWAQNDMPEFLLFFIDCLHTSISRNIIVNNAFLLSSEVSNEKKEFIKMNLKDYSELKELFFGFYSTEIISLSRNAIHSKKDEMYFMLDLSIPHETYRGQSLSIYDCLDKFITEEILQEENAWFNETTNKKESVIKRTRFILFPTILVISFKRFDSYLQKNNIQIDFPLEGLNLNKYKNGSSSSGNSIYNLYGVCNHMGNVRGGHYMSFIKKGENWYMYNDTQISIIEDIKTQIVTPMAYCLFYRKDSTL